MLIHNKDDIEFVTEFPCFSGHPVYKYAKSLYIVTLKFYWVLPGSFSSWEEIGWNMTLNVVFCNSAETDERSSIAWFKIGVEEPVLPETWTNRRCVKYRFVDKIFSVPLLNKLKLKKGRFRQTNEIYKLTYQ